MIIKIESYSARYGELLTSEYMSAGYAKHTINTIAHIFKECAQVTGDIPARYYIIKEYHNLSYGGDLIIYKLQSWADFERMSQSIIRQIHINPCGEHLRVDRLYHNHWICCWTCCQWCPSYLTETLNHTHCERCIISGRAEQTEAEEAEEAEETEDCDLRDYLRDYRTRVSIPYEVLGSSKLRLGFELEITKGNSNLTETDCQNIIDTMTEKKMLPKKDGTVYAEMVSQPLPLKEASEKVTDVVNYLKQYGFTAWNENRAGFHIHVTKRAVKNQSNLVLFFEKYAETLKKVSGRTHWDYCYYDLDHIKGNLEHHRDRYCALNFLNRSTIEFRLWRGSLKVERLLMYLKLSDCLARYSQHLASWTPTDVAFVVDDPFFDSLAIEAGEIDEVSLAIARQTLKRGNARSLITYLKKHNKESLVD